MGKSGRGGRGRYKDNHHRLDNRMKKLNLSNASLGDGAQEEILEQKFAWLPEDAGENAVTDKETSSEGTSETQNDVSNDSSSVFFVDTMPNPKVAVPKERLRQEEDFISLKPKTKVKEKKAIISESEVSSSDEVDAAASDYIKNILQSVQSNDGDDEMVETDEGFAKLVMDYRKLLNFTGQNEVDSYLDDEAARILRDRRRNDPKYAQMSQAQFDDVICFDEVYGVRKGRSLQARLHRKLKGTPGQASSSNPTSSAGRRGRGDHGFDEINFKALNREIKMFIREEGDETMETDPQPPMIRKLIHELAHLYGLKSVSHGQGVDRHCVLVKGESSRMPRDLKRLDRFIESAQKAVAYAYAENTQDKNKKKKGKKATTKSAPLRTAVKPATGTVVGATANPIDDTNVGNKLLQKLGWSPGKGLGSSQSGRIDPVQAIYKGNRGGLGS